MKTPKATRQAFSLAELLVVVAIMTFLCALTAPALKTMGASQILRSGARISGLMESARNTAILARQPVAVAMLTADHNSIQRFTVLQYVPPGLNAAAGAAGSWKRISKWESFPTGILADAGTDSANNLLAAFQPAYSPKVASALPGLVYSGTTYPPGVTPGYGYVIFRPDGSLYQDSAGAPPIPCVLRIVEGIGGDDGAIKSYTGPKDASGKPADYCDIVVSDATGQVKIVSP